MGGVRHPTVASDGRAGVPGPTIRGPQVRVGVARRPGIRWRGDAAFALGVVALVALTVFVLTMGGNAMSRSPVAARPATPTATTSTSSATATPPTSGSAQVIPAHERTYALPGPNAGLMQPAVDAQGNVWFGEMDTNRLGRLNPRTGQVSTWQPPHGQYNIMQTAVDRQGNVWFTEQAANYIGRFDPGTQQFTTYPLENPNGHGSAPQDLAFDATGKLWFTEVTAAKIGRLDPATGAISTWPVPAPETGASAYPYSLALTPDGAIWVGYLSGGALGRLDPTSGSVRLYRLANTQAQVFSMAADAQGRVWFTELEDGKIGVVDSASSQAKEISVPAVLGSVSGLYALIVAPDGDVWFACASANALVRYAPQTGRFTFYTLSAPASVPFGLALDASSGLWFTADGNPANYVGIMHI
ncbi:MAG TPA: hypothetical protein VGS80_24065 [Ktedonobacterales bacterium]|nr:hypothetical protein [Ktedonobacterales bacterium]